MWRLPIFHEERKVPSGQLLWYWLPLILSTKLSSIHREIPGYNTHNPILSCFPADLHSVSFELLSGKAEDGTVLRLHKSLHNHPKKTFSLKETLEWRVRLLQAITSFFIAIKDNDLV